MANLTAAKKDLRQTDRRTARNKVYKAEIKSLRVKLRKLLTAGDSAGAGDTAKLLGKKLDKAVTKGFMKKNTVARYKSRMMKKLNATSK